LILSASLSESKVLNPTNKDVFRCGFKFHLVSV
jgi:hypothetical protein